LQACSGKVVIDLDCPAPPGNSSSGGPGDVASSSASGAGGAGTGGEATTGGDEPTGGGTTTELDDRERNYGAALKYASLKMIGSLPDLRDIQQIGDAVSEAEQAAIYEDKIDAMLDDPRYPRQLIGLWREIFRVQPDEQHPARDGAAVFAARLISENQDIRELVTAQNNTCPTYDESSGFSDGECSNAQSLSALGWPSVGVLTDPGIMAAHYGSMAFARARVFREAFMLRAGSGVTVQESVGLLFGVADPCGVATGDPVATPYAISLLAGDCNDAPIDFLQVDSVGYPCVRCHVSYNLLAPMFAVFDDTGDYTGVSEVPTPVEGMPTAQTFDWLAQTYFDSTTQPYRWRYELPAVSTIPELGELIASDPLVHITLVRHMWAWAFSLRDRQNVLVEIPDSIVEDLADELASNGYDLGAIVRAIYLHDDFTQF